jgi:hypothetical protein
VADKHHDWNIRLGTLQSRRHDQATHGRHFVIDEGKVSGHEREEFQAGLCTRCHEHFVSRLFQQEPATFCSTTLRVDANNQPSVLKHVLAS